MKTLLLLLISFTLSAQKFDFTDCTPTITKISKCVDITVRVPFNTSLEKIVNCNQVPTKSWYSLEEKEKLRCKYPGIVFVEVEIKYSDGRVEVMTLKELRNRICGRQT